MKRRDFIRNGVLSIGAVSLGAGIVNANNKNDSRQEPQPSQSRLHSIGTVAEPTRSLPIVAEADVVVVGGGPAGVAAAISAARGGASVILLERYGFLGGLWTGGEVLPVLNTHGADANGEFVTAIKGVMHDITSRLFDIGMAINPKAPVVDPEATKYVLAEMLNELNVRVVYHSWASNVIVTANRIEHVVLETKSGRIAISGKYFIDCTGDGDIFCWAGEPFTERRHHIGAMWRVGHAENSKAGGPTPISGVRIMHTGGEYNQDGLDVFNLSDLQYRLRKYMWDETQKARQAEGCSDLFLLDTPSQIGVRCTRVLSSRHIVTMDETMSRTAYHDVIGMSGGSIGFTHNGQKYKARQRPIWQIPYRALLPQLSHNLLVAGRCFGFDEPLTYDAREIGTCFVTGQAAGTAAALALNSRCAVSEVDVATLQKQLRDQQVLLNC